MPKEHIRSARIEARIAPDALAVVKRAAEMQGRSVTISPLPQPRRRPTRPSKRRASSGFRSRTSSVSWTFWSIPRRCHPLSSEPGRPTPGWSGTRGDGGLSSSRFSVPVMTGRVSRAASLPRPIFPETSNAGCPPPRDGVLCRNGSVGSQGRRLLHARRGRYSP